MPLQPSKADSPIFETLLGITTEVSPVQPLNADGPMLVNPLEKDIEDSELQYAYLQTTLYQQFSV